MCATGKRGKKRPPADDDSDYQPQPCDNCAEKSTLKGIVAYLLI